MKLLFCIKSMNHGVGGAERVLAQVVNGLTARGHDLQLLSFDSPGGESHYALDPRIKRIDLGEGLGQGRSTPMTLLRSLTPLRATVKKVQPDAVIGFLPTLYVPLAFALLGTGRSLIASDHIVWKHYSERPIWALLLRTVSFLVWGMTCVSEQARASFPPMLQRKLHVLPNPVELKSAIPADVSGADRPRKTLLTVGRLVPQKDHETLVKAFASVATELADWDLRVVGEGDLRGTLGVLIQRLGLEGRVALPGAIADINSEYANAQLFVLPSRYESLGLTTAEALAHGLPAIGFSDCPGTNQLIKPGRNGILVEGGKDRVKALAAALRRLMADQATRISLMGGLMDSEEETRIEPIVTAWETLIERATTTSTRSTEDASRSITSKKHVCTKS